MEHHRHAAILSGGLAALLAGLLLVFMAVGTAGTAVAAAPSLDDWRAEAARVRMLAETDLPAAHEAALRLQAALPAYAMPADRAKALNVLARVEVYLGRTEQAGQHAEAALAMAKAANDRIGQAEADLNITLNAVNQGRIARLREAAMHSLTVLQGVNRPDLLVEAMLRTSVMYRRYGQLDESVALALQTMEVARQSNNPLARAYAHQGLGISFAQSFRRAEAHDHFQQMLHHARLVPSRLLEAAAIQGLGDHFTAAGDIREGERLFRLAMNLYQRAGAPLFASHSKYSLSDNLIRQRRHDEALTLIGEMEDAYRRSRNPIGLWYTLNLRSDTQHQLKDTKAAMKDALEAYEIARSIGFPLYIGGSAQRLAALEAAQGNFRSAYEYGREAASAGNLASEERAGARMQELTEHYKAQAQSKAIDELRHRNELQAAELRQRTLQQRLLWTLLGAVLLALVGSGWFLLRLRRSSQAIRQLNASLEQRVQEATAGLRQQTSYLRTLVDTLPLMVWLKDTQGRYLAVNQATAQSCGKTVDHMVGHVDAELWPAPVAGTLQASDHAVIQGRGLKRLEAPLLVRNSSGWYEFHMAPVMDGEAVIGLVGAAQDVSERKAAEAAREAALDEARRLAQQRSDFLAQMSHELRTPLNGILGFAQILQRDKPLTDRQARGLAVIEQSGEHLLALINDILDLARIDAARLELEPAEVDLRGLLAVVCDIVRVKADEKHVLFSSRIDERLPRAVRVDEKRLRQVLLNLLSNAVKFTDKGEVRLSVSLPSPPGTTARVRFEVQDSGIGMNEQQLARLFHPFEQVGDARRREGGTGLGLAISRQLVTLMGGDIHVRSTPGSGSCFWFDAELPVVQDGAQPELPQAMPHGYEGPRRKVLVADDVAQNRAVMVEGLAQLGFEVHEAEDGGQAVARALSFRPDLVVMDLAMPVMDGLEAMRRIHAVPGLEKLPVIVASGNTSPQVHAQSLRAGARAFMSKPIDQHVLVMNIGRLLELRWTDEAAPAPAPADAGESWHVDEVPPPPPEHVEELYRLVRMGHMRRICEQADRLEHADPQFARLSQRLRSLAQGCQTKGLMQLVERLRVPPDASVRS